jgi:hypothetical protein
VGRRRSFPHLTPTLSAPEGGEGNFELPADRFQHAPNIFHYIPIPEPDHSITVAGKLQASILVPFGTKRVLSAIQLNDQLCRRTGEIRHVSANWMLTTKSVREPEFAQLPPQPPLGLRHISPQPACDSRFSF